MSGIDTFLERSGLSSRVDFSGGSASTTEPGKYPALSDAVLLSLTNGKQITADAVLVLSKPFTFDQAVALYDNDDIDDETTFALITGRRAPIPRDDVRYSVWMPSPALGIVGVFVSNTFQEVTVPPGEAMEFSDNLRVTFEGQVRLRLVSDTDKWPPAPQPAIDYSGVYLRTCLDRSTISAKMSNGKRLYQPAGVFGRFVTQVLDPMAAGTFEYRYVYRAVKK